MRKIWWNNLAREDFHRNINFLIENWSEKEAQNFIDQVDSIINLLKKGNIDFQ